MDMDIDLDLDTDRNAALNVVSSAQAEDIHVQGTDSSGRQEGVQMNMEWISEEEFHMPVEYNTLLRRYFESTIDEDWVMSIDGYHEDFFREYRIWKENLWKIHMGPFVPPEEYQVIRTITNGYVAKWIEAGWVVRYSPEMYKTYVTTYNNQRLDQPDVPLENDMDDEESDPDIDADASDHADDYDANIDRMLDMEDQIQLELASDVPMMDVVEDEYYDTDYEYETDDDMPALYDTMTGEYLYTRSLPIPPQPTAEYVLLQDPNEMMPDVCCICLEHHERCNAVTLKNDGGNSCHEIGMTCFLKWSERSRSQYTPVQCPLCKSDVSAIIYQYCLPMPVPQSNTLV